MRLQCHGAEVCRAWGRRQARCGVVLLLLTFGVGVLDFRGAALADVAFPANVVQVENGLPGSAGWRRPRAPGRSIEGYASEVSVLPFQRLHLHVSTVPAARYRVEVFRLGWYGGEGGRLIACLPACDGDEAGVVRAVPAFDPRSGYLAAGWPASDTLTIGPDWVSGYYLADLVLTSGPDAGKAGWVPFIVREPSSRRSAILVQAAVNTWQAYNRWGGMSLYENAEGASCKGVCTHVSFDRPYDQNSPNLWEFELPLVHFLEERGYDVSYTTDVDTDRDPAELLRHRLVVAAGHDEYWTHTMRDAFERARALGTNLAFTGANTGYWQMRYGNNRRTIVEYRRAKLDPEPDPALKTIRFRSLAPPRPECELEGVQYTHSEGERESIGGPFDYSVNDDRAHRPVVRRNRLRRDEHAAGAGWLRVGSSNPRLRNTATDSPLPLPRPSWSRRRPLHSALRRPRVQRRHTQLLTRTRRLRAPFRHPVPRRHATGTIHGKRTRRPHTTGRTGLGRRRCRRQDNPHHRPTPPRPPHPSRPRLPRPLTRLRPPAHSLRRPPPPTPPTAPLHRCPPRPVDDLTRRTLSMAPHDDLLTLPPSESGGP